jgi:hypothetical protein
MARGAKTCDAMKAENGSPAAASTAALTSTHPYVE